MIRATTGDRRQNSEAFSPPLAAGLIAAPTALKSTIRVLIAEDDRPLREGLLATIRGEGYDATAVESGAAALNELRTSRFDIVITDLHMTPVSGADVLAAVTQAKRGTLVVVITGNPTLASAIEILRAGAWDYLPKPFTATHLHLLLGRAVHVLLQQRELSDLRAQLLRKAGHSEQVTLLGRSSAFDDAVRLARRVALTNASVLISGESGAGKELFAQFIHQNSSRALKPMVAINCAALPEPLLESEMFGHRKGAFTGADRDKLGLLETAHGGTMLLDEVTEMPLALQAKLLRVLQDGVVRRVGSERTDAVVDVRFIAATNRDPQEAVRNGTLRADLLYRLRVVPITVPPLRDRKDDIPLLAAHFLAESWARHHPTPLPAPRLAPAALEHLRLLPWHGNVRELHNVMEHLAVLAEPGQTIKPENLPVMAAEVLPEERAGMPSEMLREKFHVAKDRLVTQFERVYLCELVDRAAGNLARAARMAGIDRATLYRLIEKHHIPIPRDPALKR
ncbi:MAG: sigma-54-dependent transcriptional regulator [Gemmatimonadaceae bacterium]